MKPVSIGPFVGINNRLPDSKLDIIERGRKVGDFLRNAVNVDLTDSGTIRRRAGTELVQAGEDAHSLWAYNDYAFVADGDKLYRLDKNLGRTIVREGLTPGRAISYAHLDGHTYWSNGAAIERVIGNVSAPLSIPVPNPAPTFTAATGGSLPAGTYQFCATASNEAGEESGATWPVQLDVPENGVVAVTGMTGMTGITRLYMTPQNGDVLFMIVDTTNTEYTIPVVPALTYQLQTLGLRPMPAGGILRMFNGRLISVTGDTLYFSEPYAPALYNPMRGFIPFPGRISVVEPCQNGVFVVADQTYWLAGGDLADCKPEVVLPYGAARGASGNVENTEDVWWFSERGVVVGSPDGKVKNIQEADVIVDEAASGAGLFREQNGVRQMISSLFDTEDSVAAASSFMSAEIIRKGSML